MKSKGGGLGFVLELDDVVRVRVLGPPGLDLEGEFVGDDNGNACVDPGAYVGVGVCNGLALALPPARGSDEELPALAPYETSSMRRGGGGDGR